MIQMKVESEPMLTKTQTEVLIISSLVTKEFINVKKRSSKCIKSKVYWKNPDLLKSERGS